MSDENGVAQVKKKIVMLTNDLEKYREKATKCEKDTKSLRERAEKVNFPSNLILCNSEVFRLSFASCCYCKANLKS